MNTQINLIKELAMHECLDSLCTAKAEMDFINRYSLKGVKWSNDKNKRIEIFSRNKNIKSASDLAEWREIHSLLDESEFEVYLDFAIKREYVLLDLIKKNGETLYLKYKDKLDRVLYSLIRVKTSALSMQLFYEIESGERSFSQAAKEFGNGPESKTNGIVGPVDLTTPHKEIAARLRTANPGIIFTPFKADEWFVILRLEYRYESEYNEQTKMFLAKLLLNSQLKKMSQGIRQSLIVQSK